MRFISLPQRHPKSQAGNGSLHWPDIAGRKQVGSSVQWLRAVEPHPPTQASLPRLLSHSVRGRAPLGPWPGLGAQGLGYRKKLSASYKHERFCTHDKLEPEGMLQRRRTVCVKLAACKKSRISHHRYSKLQASLLLVHQTTVMPPACVWNWTRSLPSQSMN